MAKQVRTWSAMSPPGSGRTRRNGSVSAESGPVRADVGAGYTYRALVALEALATGNYSPDELANLLRVHRRTAVRLLDVLSVTGFASAVPIDRQRYTLTPKIVTVAGALMLRLDIIKVGFPFVTSLRDRTNEASHLALPTQGTAVQVVQETSPHRLSVKPRVGEQCPMHASAIGKALAAHLPEQLESAIAHGLTRLTDHTITTRDALEEELLSIREQGYAIDDEEMDVGTRCVAAPVRDGFGNVVASIGISGPSVRLTHAEISRMSRAVVDEAGKLSAALGFDASSRTVLVSSPEGIR